MPDQPGSEFWADLKPIANPLKPDAQPEVFHQFARSTMSGTTPR